MFRIANSARSVLLVAACGALVACGNDNSLIGPQPAGNNAIFQNYVAIGNSITAGYQSGGINGTGQQAAYPVLLAQRMRTRFAIPLLAATGCPAPITNFQQQTRPTGAPPCALLDSARATDILNNVAVPGAASLDPTDADGTPFSNTLTSLFLGGKSQVQKALDARPTFATIWIGNNDVLGFAVADGRANAATGLLGMTSVAAFQTNYDAMIDQLTAGAPDIKGVLIGVVRVANAPIMFPASAFTTSATFKLTFDAIACGGTPNSCAATGNSTLLDASCTTAPAPGGVDYRNSLINTFLAHQIRSGAHPSIISCQPGGLAGGYPAPVGDILILDPPEQTTVQARVDAYNAHISAAAATLGFAYYDPNPTLVTLKTAGTLITAMPSYCQSLPACATPTAPFGTGMSLDGIHPGALVQREIANQLIPLINTTYSTTLALVP